MPPKRSKSQSGSAAGQKWEQAILTSQFAEENWPASVSLVIGKQAEDSVNINALNDSIASGIRKLYSVIAKEELYATVKDLGNTKSPKKGKEVPQYSEICEPCKVYLDNNDEIPLNLLARLIKYRLLHIKATDQKRRETEKKGSDGPKSAGGKAGKADKKGDRAKSAGKGKGGKKTPEPQSGKNDSKLRKRGEEDEDGKYIDDEPDDGPNHYVVISGFHHPHLIGQLAEIGVNVDCYIEMGSDDYTRYKPVTSEADEQEKDEKTLALEEEMRTQREAEQMGLDTFWKDMLPILRSAAPTSSLHNVARMHYTVADARIPDNLEDTEKRAGYGKALFEDIACMIYDLQDNKRQWQNYLKNLKLHHVPIFGEAPAVTQDSQSLAPPPQTPSNKKDKAAPEEARTDGGEKSVMESEKPPVEVDMRYYNDMMNSVPHESVSVSLILHSMLEQVVATEESLEPPSETPKPRRSDGLEDGIAKHISSMAFKLALTQEEQQMLADEFERPRPTDSTPKQPTLLSHHDEVSTRLRHLKTVDGFNPMKSELEMMGFLPLATLNEFSQPQPKVFMERAARLQELIHFVSSGGLNQAEVDRAFKQFVFECMDWTLTVGDGALCQPMAGQRDVPWDDPYPFFRGMIPLAVEEEEITPEEEKMPSEAAELSANDTSFFSDDDAMHLGAEASNVSDISEPRPSRKKKKTKKKSATPHPKAPEVPPPVASPAEESDNSRAESPGNGILKRSNSAGSRKSSSSVRFEKDEMEDQEDEFMEDKALHVSQEEWSDLNDKQQRNLDQWCFAEHMEPAVLLQVLQNVQYTHQCIDSYYHKRDHTLMVVLHNPKNKQLQNYYRWENSLHSDVGFRNYMEHVSDSIYEWTREEEAKYEAGNLQKEVEHITKEAEEIASKTASDKGDKKGKGGKDKKGAKSPRSRSHSRSSSQEKLVSDNPFVRGNSLKAYKEEIDKQKAEEEEKEREKEEKRIKSAEKRRQKEEETKSKDDKKKRPTSRGSVKSKTSKDEVPTIDGAVDGEGEEKVPEDFWPFKGYDVGNNLVHVYGEVTTALPADGGIIRTEKINYVQGPSLVKCSVIKDEHTFLINVQDPLAGAVAPPTALNGKPDETLQGTPREDSDSEDKDKPVVGSFGSFNANFKDGMSLAFSIYGREGEPSLGKTYEPAQYEPPAPPTPVPTDGKGSPAKSKKDKGKSTTPEPPPEIDEPAPTIEEPIPVIPQSYQQLNVTCPDGLNISYQLQSTYGIAPENEDDRNIVVKQSYPFKTRGSQQCEAQRYNAMKEISRVINTDGVVVKTLQDGLVQVLYPSGCVTEFVQNSPLLPTGSRGASPHRPGSAGKSPERDTPSPTKKGKGGRRSAKKKGATDDEENQEQEAIPSGFWITTEATGERVCTRMDASKVPVKDALISVASDPSTNQSMQTREDHVVCVKHPDGTNVVEHSDGTRITSFWRHISIPSSDAELEETGETLPAEMKEVKVVVVECPGFATVKFDQSSMLQCSTEFGSGTVIHGSVDGSYDIYHNDGGYLQVEVDGSAQYFPHPNNELEVHNPNHQLQYSMRHFADVIVETVDNEGNVFNVKNDGTCVVMRANEEDEQTEGVEYFKQHAPRLFIVHPDGSGTELLRYQDISEYMANAEDDPATAILMDSLPDCPGILGITVLRPHNKGLSEKWLKPYLQDTIVPPGLVSRDLSTLPAFEEKKPGPNFGTTAGAGLAVGSAVKGTPVFPIIKCPNILQVRQILQYKPITEEQRTGFWKGLREYGEFIRSKLETMEGLLVEEPRSAKEQATARKLQELALQRQSAIPAPANTKPVDNIKHNYEKALAPPIPSPPPTPQPKRTKADWERDQRELAEEMENRRKIKNREVPPYFRSEMGKAFLLTQAPDLDSMTRELKEDPRTDATRAIRSNSNSPGSHPHAVGTTPSNLRPGNPTPAHAQGSGSPSSVRPKNPTPAHAHKAVPDRPGAPTPKDAGPNNPEFDSPNSNVIPSIPEENDEQNSTGSNGSNGKANKLSPLNTSVTGEMRNGKVHVPAYLSTGRPLAAPNVRYTMVEDPVRRKVYNSSVAGATPQGSQILNRMRGFEFLPDRVNFGVLREGSTYAFAINLKNTGVDSCRFRVKQPPPSTGMKALYKPGPVAAGMKAEITIEIYAIAVGVEGGSGVGNIGHNLEIVTETDHLYLPIKATVMTAYEYDNRQREGNVQRMEGAGVVLVSTKPPAGQGIIRPRKDIPMGTV